MTRRVSGPAPVASIGRPSPNPPPKPLMDEPLVIKFSGRETGDSMAKAKRKGNDTGANLGFEAKLWEAADALRNNMDAAEYKHVVLGLIFLKYISDAFEEKHQQLSLWTADQQSEWYVREPQVRYEVVEDPDSYRAENVFWVPTEARWPHLQAHAKQPEIGKLIDDAMVAVERENPV